MQKPDVPFVEFPKIARFSREVIITEKIDGTNSQIYIPPADAPDAGQIYAGSRNRWITPEADNFGFARWVEENKAELLALGPGNHFGEWWGCGIQRGYNQKAKRFSLFNVSRWGPNGKDAATKPNICDVVPVLWRGSMDDMGTELPLVLSALRNSGSLAAPGFMKPEGVVIFHVAGGYLFKKTLEKDEQPKSLAK